MTTLTAPSRPAVPVAGVSQLRVLQSEWTKLRSLRSTLWTLAVAVVVTIGSSALFTSVTASQWASSGDKQHADFDPIGISLGGFLLSQLALGVLAVLLITGEYSTGMIRASLTAVPRRLPVLWAKLAVYAGVVFGISLVISIVSFLLGQALLGSTGRAIGLGSPGAFRSVVGAALYVTVAGLIAMGIGTLLRNTAAAVTTFVGVFFVLPPLATLLPETLAHSVTPYLPSNAGGALWGVSAVRGGSALSPWVGFAVLCLYAVVVIAAGAYRLARSDA